MTGTPPHKICIVVDRKTHGRLKSIGKMHQTFDELINVALDALEGKSRK